MADVFDAMNPPKKQTDPLNLAANRDFPAHVFKWRGRDAEGNVLQNHYLPVNNEDEKAKALRAGWSEKPLHEEPAVEDEGESVPAARKPGRPKAS